MVSDPQTTPTLTVAEMFERDPFNNPPPCLRQPDKECLPDCECGLSGPCKRQQRSDALDELALIDRELL